MVFMSTAAGATTLVIALVSGSGSDLADLTPRRWLLIGLLAVAAGPLLDDAIDVVARRSHQSAISRAGPRTSISNSMATTGGRAKCHEKPSGATPVAASSSPTSAPMSCTV